MEHGECLTDDTFTEYLEGALDPAIKAASEVHLIACDDCRSRLGFFMRVLDEETTPTESQQIQLFTEAWTKKRLAPQVRHQGRSLSRWLFGLAMVASIALVVLSIRLAARRSGEPKSGADVVQVLLEQERPFESRLANEPYLSIERTRGIDERGSYPSLAAEMNSLSPSEQEMGRFHLVQKEFGQAIKYLESAAKQAEATPSVHNDLGVAYLESSDQTQLEQARREFLEALKANPKFEAAIFNLALAYERSNDPERAATEWKRYLELDSKSGWATEAQDRLTALSH